MTRLYRRPGRITRPPTCFGCRTREGVVHFNIAKPTWPKASQPGRPVMRGAGSIDLCQTCWRAAVDASRIRRGRPHRKVA